MLGRDGQVVVDGHETPADADPPQFLDAALGDHLGVDHTERVIVDQDLEQRAARQQEFVGRPQLAVGVGEGERREPRGNRCFRIGSQHRTHLDGEPVIVGAGRVEVDIVDEAAQRRVRDCLRDRQIRDAESGQQFVARLGMHGGDPPHGGRDPVTDKESTHPDRHPSVRSRDRQGAEFFHLAAGRHQGRKGGVQVVPPRRFTVDADETFGEPREPELRHTQPAQRREMLCQRQIRVDQVTEQVAEDLREPIGQPHEHHPARWHQVGTGRRRKPRDIPQFATNRLDQARVVGITREMQFGYQFDPAHRFDEPDEIDVTRCCVADLGTWMEVPSIWRECQVGDAPARQAEFDVGGRRGAQDLAGRRGLTVGVDEPACAAPGDLEPSARRRQAGRVRRTDDGHRRHDRARGIVVDVRPRRPFGRHLDITDADPLQRSQFDDQIRRLAEHGVEERAGFLAEVQDHLGVEAIGRRLIRRPHQPQHRHVRGPVDGDPGSSRGVHRVRTVEDHRPTARTDLDAIGDRRGGGEADPEPPDLPGARVVRGLRRHPQRGE